MFQLLDELKCQGGLACFENARPIKCSEKKIIFIFLWDFFFFFCSCLFSSHWTILDWLVQYRIRVRFNSIYMQFPIFYYKPTFCRMPTLPYDTTVADWFVVFTRSLNFVPVESIQYTSIHAKQKFMFSQREIVLIKNSKHIFSVHRSYSHK